MPLKENVIEFTAIVVWPEGRNDFLPMTAGYSKGNNYNLQQDKETHLK